MILLSQPEKKTLRCNHKTLIVLSFLSLSHSWEHGRKQGGVFAVGGRARGHLRHAGPHSARE